MKKNLFFPALLLLLLTPGVASAAVSAVSFTGGGLADYTADDVTGYRFTVGPADLVVTALGFWDADGDGLSDAHDVAIYSVETEFFETMTTVPSGFATTLMDGFRYEAVEPVTLYAGESYVILGYRPTGTDAVVSGVEGLSIAPYMTLDGDAAGNNTGGLVFTITSYGSPDAWFGPNFQAEVVPGVPEPTTALLLGLTTSGLLRRRRSNGKLR